MTLTQQHLKERLHYSPSTGVWTWRRDRKPYLVGQRAGTLRKSGYRAISIDNVVYLEHRLAFLYMLGRWPTADTDHRNRVRDDNRWCNLREATKAQNMLNTAAHRDSSSQYKGVSWHAAAGKWAAQICRDGVKTHLGLYSAELDAAAAYATAIDRANEFETHDGELPPGVSVHREYECRVRRA